MLAIFNALPRLRELARLNGDYENTIQIASVIINSRFNTPGIVEFVATRRGKDPKEILNNFEDLLLTSLKESADEFRELVCGDYKVMIDFVNLHVTFSSSIVAAIKFDSREEWEEMVINLKLRDYQAKIIRHSLTI